MWHNKDFYVGIIHLPVKIRDLEPHGMWWWGKASVLTSATKYQGDFKFTNNHWKITSFRPFYKGNDYHRQAITVSFFADSSTCSLLGIWEYVPGSAPTFDLRGAASCFVNLAKLIIYDY